MDPLYAMMAPASNEEELNAMADALRGRRRAADVFALSTVDNIARGAQAEQKAVAEGAQQQGVLRRALAERQQREDQAKQARDHAARMQQGQIDAQIDAARVRQSNVAPNTFQLGDGSIANVFMRDGVPVNQHGDEVDLDGAVPYKAPAAGRGSTPGFRWKHQEERYEGVRNALSDYSKHVDMFKPGYGNPSWIPGYGTGRQMLEQITPLGDDGRATFWASMESDVKREARHEAFGGALTKIEKPLFERAEINPNMDDRYIMVRMEIQREMLRAAAEHEVIQALRNGHKSPEDVMYEYGNVLPDIERVIGFASDYEGYQQHRTERAAKYNAILDQQDEEMLTGDMPRNRGITPSEQSSGDWGEATIVSK